MPIRKKDNPTSRRNMNSRSVVRDRRMKYTVGLHDYVDRARRPFCCLLYTLQPLLACVNTTLNRSSLSSSSRTNTAART